MFVLRREGGKRVVERACGGGGVNKREMWGRGVCDFFKRAEGGEEK